MQGVFFRASTQEYARSLGLIGWVKNRKDGSVELIAYDPKTPTKESSQYEKLQIWCQHGPKNARVTHIDSEWLEEKPDAAEFLILRS